MDTKTLKEKSKQDLLKRLEEKEQEIKDLKYDHKRGIVKDTSDFKKIRKEIARIKTILKSNN